MGMNVHLNEGRLTSCAEGSLSLLTYMYSLLIKLLNAQLMKSGCCLFWWFHGESFTPTCAQSLQPGLSLCSVDSVANLWLWCALKSCSLASLCSVDSVANLSLWHALKSCSLASLSLCSVDSVANLSLWPTLKSCSLSSLSLCSVDSVANHSLWCALKSCSLASLCSVDLTCILKPGSLASLCSIKSLPNFHTGVYSSAVT